MHRPWPILTALAIVPFNQNSGGIQAFVLHVEPIFERVPRLRIMAALKMGIHVVDAVAEDDILVCVPDLRIPNLFDGVHRR